MRSNAQSLVFNPLDRRKDTSYGGSSNFERSNVLPVLGPRSGGDALLVGLLIAVSAEFGAVDPPRAFRRNSHTCTHGTWPLDTPYRVASRARAKTP